jgi:pimeloyl-ACP methyl ester carboxylesterase
MNPSQPAAGADLFAGLEQHCVSANGADFNYYRTAAAPGRKPALVLQHGFSDNGLCWAPVAQELAGDYDILMPDAHGHGQSARLAPGERVDRTADLAAVMRALGIRRAALAGHSMGAHIVADLAARFPDLAAALVLEEPPWRLAPPSATAAAPSPDPSQWFIDQQNKSLEQIMAECREAHPTWPEPYVRAWSQGKLEMDLNALVFFGRDSDAWRKYVPAIQCPALLITGDPAQGGIVTPEMARAAQDMNPKIRVHHFPGVGHHVRFAAHADYMEAFQAFLRAVDQWK